MWGLIGTALFDWGGPQGMSAGEEAADEDGMCEIQSAILDNPGNWW